jgi:hypothetical protein
MTIQAKWNSIDWTSLRTILFFGLIIRLIAAIFSEGYAMHDDHYLVIEAAGSWVDGMDYNHWLPWSPGNNGNPEGHSFTYVGLNYLLFSFLKWIGIADPKMLMLINRILHAVFSLLIIRYGYLITKRLADKKVASYVGWMLALLWAMPFLSVRNLVEITSIPFLMMSVWFMIKDSMNRTIFISGVMLGMAVSFRYQIALYGIGTGLFFMLRGEWKRLMLYTAGALLVFSLTQGLVDYLIWGYPFAEFKGYVVYNMNEGTGYMTYNKDNYFMYFYVLFGFMLFPMGILGFIGYFKSYKKYWGIFLPTLLFLLFHTWFPNRQERFILTIFPLVLMLAVLGIHLLIEKPFWAKFWRISWVGFWIINIPFMLIISTMPSKKSRVDTMYSLYGKVKGNERILIEATGKTNPEMMPFFYAGKWKFSMSERWNTDTTSLDTINKVPKDYIFFFGKDSLEPRIQSFKKYYPEMELKDKIDPSLVDQVLQSINPRNSNSYVEVWKTNTKE